MKHTISQFTRSIPSILMIIFVLILFTQCSTYKLFQHGEVELKNKEETLSVDFSNQLPIVQVEINGKAYHFLIDTGAPTVISKAIYEELNLKTEIKKKVSDSQGQKQHKIFCILPEMKVGDIVFKDTPAAVIDWTKNYALTCLKLDGILGANQMEGAIWKFDYKDEKVTVTKDLSNFDISEYEYAIPFEPRLQKTPLVELELYGKTRTLIFDTGSNGGINLSTVPTEVDTLKEDKKIEVLGMNTIGMYGAGLPTKEFYFQVNNAKIGNLTFQNIILNTGNSSTIGNKLLQHFTFIVDWNENMIYLKKVSETTEDFSSFGFGYTFFDNKVVVSYVYKSELFPLEIGDTIIGINNHSFENLNNAQVCEYSQNRIENSLKHIDIEIKRKEEVLKFHLEKKSYFN